MNAPFPPPITDRELRWLRHIAIHGPQSSEFLLELCADTHSCRDTGLRALQKLREQQWLRLPKQQEEISKANCNPHVYDLTRQAEAHMQSLGDPETTRPTGHWWHGYMTASVSSALAITAARQGYRYIPAHEILNRRNATLAIPHGKQKVFPDQLFAINYGGKFRSFVLEVDRGTEPYHSQAARKSVQAMLQRYDDLWVKDAARNHYGLKSPLALLLVFTSRNRADAALQLLRSRAQCLRQTTLVQTIPAAFPRFEPISSAIAGAWETGDGARRSNF